MSVINAATNTVTSTIGTGTNPSGIAFATTLVPYPFTGFLLPVKNPPAVNTRIPGLPVALRFQLGSNQGLNIIDSGYPTVQRTDCATGATVGSPVPARTVPGIGLFYVKATGTYWYTWQTRVAWRGTCQTFAMKLNDGTTHTALFRF